MLLHCDGAGCCRIEVLITKHSPGHRTLPIDAARHNQYCGQTQVHLLGESERGPALEAGVVSRIKMVGRRVEMQQCPISQVRFVAVSATIPNIKVRACIK